MFPGKQHNLRVTCECGASLLVKRVNGYMKCGRCGAQHTTSPNGMHVCTPGARGAHLPVDEPIPVPADADAITLDEIDHFGELLHNDHILPEDF